MKQSSTKTVFLLICISMLLPMILGMGQPGYSGSGGILSGILNIPIIPLLFILTAIIIPIVKAFIAAKEAEKFKTLVFILTFYEWLGWILCVTIIGIPIGLGLVLTSQLSRVFIQIESNTNKTLKILKSQNRAE